MPRSAKIVRGHRYQVGRFAGSWYVADLDQNRFVYGPFLRRETAEARLKKIVHMSRVRNPKSPKIPEAIIQKSSTPYLQTKIKELRREYLSSTVLTKKEQFYLHQLIIGIQKELDKRGFGSSSISNPEWKPPFAQRKRKRLGELYRKAFVKFSKENPRHLKCKVCGKGTIHFVHGKPIHKTCYAKLSQVRTVKPNPRRGVLIYGRVLKIFARKTQGPYKGQEFVHEFEPGAIMVGMPDGSIRISHP